MTNVFDLFQNTGPKNQVRVDLAKDYYDTAPMFTEQAVAQAQRLFASQPPFDAQGFLRAYRQKLKEPGQVVIVIDSISPLTA